MIETIKWGADPRPGLILPPWYPKRKHRKHHPARKQEGMLWVPHKGVLRIEHNLGGVGTTSLGSSVTTGGSASTKGTPVQLIASTAFDAYWITILASSYGTAATTSQGCLDILIGAATEEVLIPNLLMGFCGASGTILGIGHKRWSFPLYIPASSRISAQVAGDRTGTAMRVGIILYGGNGVPPFPVGSKVTTYGITTVPAGTDVAAGYSGTEGAWAQIAASTSEGHFAFLPSFHPTDGDTSLTPVKQVYMDMGIGAATEEFIGGAEQSYIFRYGTDECCEGPWQDMPTFQDVPSGTRLVARLSMSGVTDTGEPDCAIHAMS